MDTNFLRRRAWWTRREQLDIKVIYTQIRYKIVGNERSSGINGWQQLSDGKIEILITDGSNANFCSFIEPTVWLCDIVSRNRWKIRHEFFQTPAQQISNQLFALKKCLGWIQRNKENIFHLFDPQTFSNLDGKGRRNLYFAPREIPPLPPLLFPKGNNFVAETAGLKATAGTHTNTGDRRSV